MKELVEGKRPVQDPGQWLTPVMVFCALALGSRNSAFGPQPLCADFTPRQRGETAPLGVEDVGLRVAQVRMQVRAGWELC